MQKLQLTRHQRRHQERVIQDAKNTFAMLTNKFFTYFTNSDDPLGYDVAEKRKSLNAIWKTYCHRARLINGASDKFNLYCDELVADYKNNLDATN